jgi:hypothetical protein
VVVFLEALAEEWLRCESVYMDVLPAIYKVQLLGSNLEMMLVVRVITGRLRMTGTGRMGKIELLRSMEVVSKQPHHCHQQQRQTQAV